MTALRPRLEHAQMMTKADMIRLGKLGGKYPSLHIQHLIDFLLVIASIQPTHACVLIYIYIYASYSLSPRLASVTCGMLKIGWSVLFFLSRALFIYFVQGPERVKSLYAFRSLLDSGARITLGSDFPVETMNPLAGFYAAITRKSPDGKSPHGPDGW